MCRLWLVVTPGLPPGEHSVVYRLVLDAAVGDGTFRYPASASSASPTTTPG